MMKTMKSVRSAIGLHVDDHEFQAVQLVKTAGDVQVGAWAVFPRLRSPQIEDDQARTLPEKEELIWASSILSRRGFHGLDYSLSAPSRLCTQHVFELPPADSGAPLEMLARTEVARERRCDPSDFAIGFWGLPQRGRTAETIAVACSNQVITDMIQAAQSADLEVVGIDLKELAILRAVQEHLPETTRDGDTPINAVLHIGWDHALAIVTLGARLVYVRRIALGAQGAWEQAITRYGLSENSARAVFGDYGLEQSQEQLEKIRATCWQTVSKDLAADLDVAIAYVSHSFRMAPLGRIVISGYGAEDAVLRSQLDRVIGIPAVSGVPSQLAELIDCKHQGGIAARLSQAYGLAERFDS